MNGYIKRTIGYLKRVGKEISKRDNYITEKLGFKYVFVVAIIAFMVHSVMDNFFYFSGLFHLETLGFYYHIGIKSFYIGWFIFVVMLLFYKHFYEVLRMMDKQDKETTDNIKD